MSLTRSRSPFSKRPGVSLLKWRGQKVDAQQLGGYFARVGQAHLPAGIRPALLSGRDRSGISRTKTRERRVFQRNYQGWLGNGGRKIHRFPWRHGEPRDSHLLIGEFDVDGILSGRIALLR